jgi:hypothetical protein
MARALRAGQMDHGGEVPGRRLGRKAKQTHVMLGGAWEGWDAWLSNAPTFDRIPAPR